MNVSNWRRRLPKLGNPLALIGRNARVEGRRRRDNSNLDLVLARALANGGDGLGFPVAYVEFLRTCLESRCVVITEVQRIRGGEDTEADRRFASLLCALAALPPLEFATAERLAGIADDLRGDASPIASGNWAGDVGAHFEMSSSFGCKGRILTTIVRFMRCHRVLELGTAYGMSALFLLEVLSRQGPDARLLTVEGSRTQYDIASTLLERHFNSQVTCAFGWTSVVLPGLVGTEAPVDFLFHDAGHSRMDYVNDFAAALPLLGSGAVVLIDDIAWDDPRFAAQPPRCRAGWREVARHPRVRRAVELDGEMGLVLLT